MPYTSRMEFIVPEVVTAQFHLRPGDRVGDLGAGSGFFLQPLSRAVGSEGKVYAVEIQRTLAETLTNKLRTDGLSNVEVIWGDLEAMGGTKIKDGSLDAIVLSNTLSMIEDKATFLVECKRILRKGGKFILIDWSDSFGGMGPAPHMVVTAEAATTLLQDAGFKLERSFVAGGHHYGLAFRI